MTLRAGAVQLVLWLTVGASLAVCSQWPTFAPIAAAHGELKLSLVRLTERLEACRTLSADELAALPPNMRIAEQCPRGRAPATLVITANGQELLRRDVQPAGLHRNGPVYLHEHWQLAAGDYTLQLALRDGSGAEGFDHEQTLELTLEPGASVLLQIGNAGATLIMPDTPLTPART